MSENTKPTLASVLNRAIAGALDDVRVALPGKVVKYDATKQRVDVQPLVKDSYIDEAGARKLERLPVIPDVPVVFPGSGAFRITFPVKVGDTILLVFSSSSLARWKVSGNEVDPGDDRHHALPDAIAIPGLTAKPGTQAPTNATVIHDTVWLGGLVVEPTFKADTFLVAFATLISAIGTAVGGIPGGAAAGTAIGTALTAFQASVISAKTTKAKVM